MLMEPAAMRVLLLLAVASGARVPRRPSLRRQTSSHARPSTANCTWRTLEQPMDHFGGAPGTFPQRYCVYEKYWSRAAEAGFSAATDKKGPIFFYTGNESPVEEYVNSTGLMWELGEKMGALLVWAEHRYEPGSHPALQGVADCFAYATTAQALADYASLIASIKHELQTDSPVVAFGGSYGGMLAGWFRMKYPDVVVGSVAGSAPIWGLASSLTKASLDLSAQAISRSVSKAGGATDQCMENIRHGWTLLRELGRTEHGLSLLSGSMKSCAPLTSAEDLIDWLWEPWFDMAEGDYPFPSTYITYAVGPGYFFLPAWPMRVACEHLNEDFGVQLTGSAEDVRYSLRLGAISVDVDWDAAQGNGADLSEAQIRQSGALELAAGLRQAVAVWYNVSGTKQCFDVGSDKEVTQPEVAPRSAPKCLDRCPPCAGCPPCPSAYCEDAAVCSYQEEISKTFSWSGVTSNEDLYLHNNGVQGVGRDMFWPPSVPKNYSVESIVGSHSLAPGPAPEWDQVGLPGAPTVTDRWSTWLDSYYASNDLSRHSNIIWSNGALDPWSGAGVYPAGGGPTGPLIQNISADGSQLALVMDLGAHHTDLFFADPNDPPAVTAARRVEEQHIRRWCQEAYDEGSWATAREQLV